VHIYTADVISLAIMQQSAILLLGLKFCDLQKTIGHVDIMTQMPLLVHFRQV